VKPMKRTVPRDIYSIVTAALCLMATLVFSQGAFGWISKEETKKVYGFKFSLKGASFEYKQSSASFEEAFERAAQACYTHFKDGKRLTEDAGLDIIDVCANPRSL
jgi:hypothetical protein